MSEENQPIIIKRYASRRLYNTELSDYVTLEEVAGYIRDGKDVKIIDRKTGDDLTRQYLLQIITDFETRGEHILPANVLFDIVRSYSDQAQNFIPEFLSQSFDMLKHQQAETLKAFQSNLKDTIPPLNAPLEGLEKWQKLQSDFLNQMMGAWAQNPVANAAQEKMAAGEPSDIDENDSKDPPAKTGAKQNTGRSTTKKNTRAKKSGRSTSKKKNEDIEALKRQLASLQSKLDDL